MKKRIVLMIVLVLTALLFTVSCVEQTYLVEFDSNGGIEVVSQVVKSNEKVQEPSGPYKENYKFVGWYLEDQKFNFNQPVDSIIKLTAKWEVICYDVVFNTDGGSSVDALKVGPGSFVKQPADPLKANYVFVGWYLGNEEFDFNQPVNSNIELIAKWESAK